MKHVSLLVAMLLALLATATGQSANPCSFTSVGTNVPLASLVQANVSAPYTTSNLFYSASAVSVQSSGLTSAVANDTIKLTTSGVSGTGSVAWLQTLYRFNDWFHLTFTYNITNYATNAVNRQAEGFAFVMLDPTAALSLARGTGSVNIGYNLAQFYSLAVEFDMHYDGSAYDPTPSSGSSPSTTTDYSCNHVEVHGSFTSKGNGPSTSNKLFPTSTAQPTWLRNNALVSGQHLVDIEYQAGYFSAGNGLLSVSIDGTAIIQYPISDASVSQIFANNTAYFGFTASTGTDSSTGASISADTYIYNVSVFTNLASAQYTKVSLNNGSNAFTQASSTQPVSIPVTVTAYDNCNKPFSISAGAFTATMIDSLSESAGTVSVSDWKNGSCSITAWSTVAKTSYQLTIANNGKPLAASPFHFTVTPAPVSAAQSTFTVMGSGSLTSLTAGVVKRVTVTLRDQYGNLNTSANLGPLDLQIVINNPGTQTSDYFNPTRISGANYTFSIVTSAATRVSSSGNPVSGAIYLTVFGSNIARSPVSGVTVSAASVSGANCTLSGNYLVSITAGATASIVLTPNDYFGNPVLTSVTGALSLVGMNTDTIINATVEWVAAQANTNPYLLFTFVPTVVDTYAIIASVGTDSQSLQPVSETRTPSITASSAVSADQSYYYGLAQSSLIAGTSNSNPGVTFAIQSVDSYGNKIGFANGNDYVLSVSVNTSDSGAETITTTCVNSGSGVVSGTVNDTTTNRTLYGSLSCAYSSSASVYAVKLVAYQTDVQYSVYVLLNGASVGVASGQPNIFSVRAAAADATYSTFTLIDTALSAGQTGSLVIRLRDSYGNQRTGYNDSSTIWSTAGGITFTPVSGSGNVLASLTGLTTDLTGVYTQTFKAITANVYSVSVQLGGSALSSSQSTTLAVIPGAFAPSSLSASGTGLQGGIIGSTQSFTLLPSDIYGNRLLRHQSANVSFFINASAVDVWSVGNVTYVTDVTVYQSYYVSYTVPTITVNASVLTVNVYQGTDAGGLLCLALQGAVLQPSTDNATVVMDSRTFTAGQSTVIGVVPRTYGANPQPTCSTDQFSLTLLSLSSNADLPLTTSLCVQYDLTDSTKCCRSNFTFTPRAMGNYRLQVLVIGSSGTSESIESAAGIDVSIVPGAISLTLSTLTAITATTLVSGTLFQFQLKFVDSNSNAWSQSPNVSVSVTSSLSETPLVPLSVTDTNDGTYTLSIAYTLATYRTLTVSIPSLGATVANGIVLTYTPADFNASLSSLTGVVSGTGAATLTAGNSVVVSVLALDMYGNAISTWPLTCSVIFTRAYDGASQTYSVQGGSTGSNFLTITSPSSVTTNYILTAPSVTLADYITAINLTVACGSTGALSAIDSVWPLTIYPATISDSLSYVTGWPITSVVSASTLSFTLHLFDSYGNEWGASIGSTPRALLSATIARNPALNVNRVAANSLVAVTGTRGQYNVSYVPTLASDSYTFAYVVDASSSHSFNSTSFTVIAQPVPSPSRTSLSPTPLNQSMVAGTSTTLTVTFADVYGNPIDALSLNQSLGVTSNVSVTFYRRTSVSYCSNGAIDVSQPVNQHFTTTGLTLSSDYQTFTLTFSGSVVGSYFVMLYVNDAPILSSCSALPSKLGFGVVHAQPSMVDSVFSTVSTGTLRAGATLSFSIAMYDAFGNAITDMSPSTVLMTPDVNANLALCQSSESVYLWQSGVDTVSAPVSGVFTISLVARTAGSYILPFTLNGELVGSPSSCPIVTIEPSFIATFNKSAESAVIAAVGSSFTLQGSDAFGNTLTAANMDGAVFTAAFTYQPTGATQPSFVFTAVSSTCGSLPILAYYADLAGNYSVTISVPADADDTTGFVPNPITYNLTVVPESCATQTGDPLLAYRCSNHSCVSSYTQCSDYQPCPQGSFVTDNGSITCLTGFPNQSLCAAGLTLCSLSSGSDNATELLAAYQLNFFCSVTCPVASVITSNSVDCGNGARRQSYADCPSSRVCPYGFITCPDSSCVAVGSSCSSAAIATLIATGQACANAGGFQCRSGRCVERAENCGTDITCPVGNVLCSDGSCQSSILQCPSAFICSVPGASYRCPNGECRINASDCPSDRTCPPGYVQCGSGQCAKTLSACTANITVCGVGQVRCHDGRCRSNRLQCPSIITCPSDRPVRCADNQCKRDVSECSAPRLCSAPTAMLCADGTCVANATMCATGVTCPPSAPVLCADQSCAVTLTQCSPLALSCPVHAPVRCADGSCKGSFVDCASVIPCPSELPIRCADSSCVSSIVACPNPAIALKCSLNQVRCPSGHCASSYALCPTQVSCSTGFSRCADGTCRTSCPMSLAFNVYTSCAAGQILCPRTSSGSACAASLSQCPTELTCPSDMPVRCVDNTCAQSFDDCPILTASITNAYVTAACVGGGWKDSLSTCGTSVTCPRFAPVKCWDESCRVSVDDCPPKVACQFGSMGAASFLCADGSCRSSPSQCSSLIQCPGGQIKCPSDTAGGAGVFCVDDASQCTNLYQLINPTSVCPNSYTRCRNGNCVPSLSSCAAFSCPAALPFACQNGACAASNASCPRANGCPVDAPIKCWDGSCSTDTSACPSSQACPAASQTRCKDGSCTSSTCSSSDDTGCPSGQVRCHDKQCAANWAACTGNGDTYNSCPANRPYRCDDGYCAVTTGACPVFPLVANTCPTNVPVLCADGSCMLSSIQCPTVRPCATGFTRCGDSSCRYAGSCPTANTCPATRPLRCQSGLCVAATVSPLTTYLESSTSSDANCIDENVRDGLTAGVADSRGCPRGQTKCIDGTCSSSCAVTVDRVSTSVSTLLAFQYPNGRANGCPVSAPLKCYDGSCVASITVCRAVNGCPLATPVLCADGTCQTSTSQCSASTTCASGGVRCPNGQCATSFDRCLAVNGCPVTFPLRCASGHCAQYPAHSGQGDENSQLSNIASGVVTLSTCPPTVICNTLKPYLCADLSCVSDVTQCRSLQQCPSSAPLYCSYTGTCMGAGKTCMQNVSSFCPISSPVMCANGGCVTSVDQCLSPIAGTSSASQCESPNVLCFDGSCTTSPQQCYQHAQLAQRPGSVYDSSANVLNATCSNSTHWPCSNGLCLWDSAPATQALCLSIAACPITAPLRCPDGSCIAAATQSACPAAAQCSTGLVRCNDGSCRGSASQCPPTNGCPLSAPLFCPGRSVSCVASLDDCPGNGLLPSSITGIHTNSGSTRRLLQTSDPVAGSQVCAENCDRSRAASAATVSVRNDQRTVIDVSYDNAHRVRTQIIVPSNGLGNGVTAFTVTPVAETSLASSSTPFTSTVLSTPFACATNDPAVSFNTNLTVNAAVDLQLPSGTVSISGGTTTSSVIAPCAVTTGPSAAFGVSPYTANAETSTCRGSLTITSTTMRLQWTSGCTSPDTGVDVTGTLTTAPITSYAPGFTTSYGASCLCYNITQSTTGPYTRSSSFCMFVGHASSSSPFIAGFSRDLTSVQTRCPGPAETATNNHYLALTAPASLASTPATCTTFNTVNSISANDICFGQFDSATESWSCVYTDYYYRQASPPWTSTSGRATNRMTGLLPSCSASAYAFIYSPAVTPVPSPGPSCDLWCQYEALILGLSIGITVFLLVSAYIIWRLIRYRRKYIANKKEHAALEQRAAHLDEYAGGLGLADEEMDMIPNPLVIEMKSLDTKIAAARLSRDYTAALSNDAESEKQLRYIRELEEQKLVLYDRILTLREAAKARQAHQATKQPSRASAFLAAQISPFSPVRLSIDDEDSQAPGTDADTFTSDGDEHQNSDATHRTMASTSYVEPLPVAGEPIDGIAVAMPYDDGEAGGGHTDFGTATKVKRKHSI